MNKKTEILKYKKEFQIMRNFVINHKCLIIKSVQKP